MFSKFKNVGLKSLNIFIRNLPSSENLILNKSKSNQSVPQTVTIHHDKRNGREDHQRNEGKLFSKTSYLLVGAFSIVYLDRQYDVFRNYLNQFKVEAKVAVNETIVKPKVESQNRSSQKINVNLRQTYNFLADAAEQAIPSVVQIEVFETDPYFGYEIKTNCGSGFVVSKDKKRSLILTNSHVVLDKNKVVVLLQNGKKLVGTVVCVDGHDLASVEIEDTSSPVLEFESSKDIRVGEFVMAIGSPLGLGNSVTAGIVSSITCRGKEIGLENDDMEYLQTDASVNMGNSGGPLIALNGKVIGINTFRVLPGINLAIPSDYAIKFLESAKKATKDKPMHREKEANKIFGITMLSLTPDVLRQLRERIKLKDDISHGVLLVKVDPTSIAEKVGLRTGDIIIEINHKKSMEAAEIYKAIEANSQMTLLVIRGDQKIRFNVSF